MRGEEAQHALVAVEAGPGSWLNLRWDGGLDAKVSLAPVLETDAYASLRDQTMFARATLGDWGHSVVWPGEIEIGADSLWLDCLSAWGQEDTRSFLEWRLRNGFSAIQAAEVLGISRPSVVRYSTGTTVPRSILLACKGWDAMMAA
jgi:hypothetical protein